MPIFRVSIKKKHSKTHFSIDNNLRVWYLFYYPLKAPCVQENNLQYQDKRWLLVYFIAAKILVLYWRCWWTILTILGYLTAILLYSQGSDGMWNKHGDFCGWQLVLALAGFSPHSTFTGVPGAEFQLSLGELKCLRLSLYSDVDRSFSLFHTSAPQ